MNKVEENNLIKTIDDLAGIILMIGICYLPPLL